MHRGMRTSIKYVLEFGDAVRKITEEINHNPDRPPLMPDLTLTQTFVRRNMRQEHTSNDTLPFI